MSNKQTGLIFLKKKLSEQDLLRPHRPDIFQKIIKWTCSAIRYSRVLDCRVVDAHRRELYEHGHVINHSKISAKYRLSITGPPWINNNHELNLQLLLSIWTGLLKLCAIDRSGPSWGAGWWGEACARVQ